jgi:hypothetical protein
MPAIVNSEVAAIHPSQIAELPHEGFDLGLRLGVGIRKRHQNTDPPHPAGLLRTRDERPRDGRRAAEQRDELPPRSPRRPIVPASPEPVQASPGSGALRRNTLRHRARKVGRSRSRSRAISASSSLPSIIIGTAAHRARRADFFRACRPPIVTIR